MIRINLFPHHRARKEKKLEIELIIYLIFFVSLIGSIFYIQHTLNSKIENLRKIKQQKNQINTLLLIQIGKFNKNKKKLRNIKLKIKTIRMIRKIQNLPVRYLYILVKHFIKNKLWIDYISLSCTNKVGKIYVKGVALDNQVLAQYIKSIRTSPYINQVFLKKAVRRKIKGYDLISFAFKITTSPFSIKSNPVQK